MVPKPIIKSVIPLHVGQFMFVKIETGDGFIGYGEAGVWGHIEAAAAAVRRFAEYLVGKAAFDIEHHWNVMHRFSYFQGLAINADISGVDITLWDIKGKAMGVPVYELLGGACRTKARVYGHIYEKNIDMVLEECKKKMDLGYTAFGYINPFLDEGNENGIFTSSTQHLSANVVDHVPSVVNGFVDIPRGPGIGINLLENAQHIRPPSL